MKILVTGASGLLGSKIVELAAKAGYDVFSGYFANPPKSGHPLRIDVGSEASISKAIAETKPNAIIHCAALTDVDRCEVEKDLAKKINVEGTELVAKAAMREDAYLVFISTDYVFDGSKGMYREDDETGPINFYGKSKLLGEKALEKINGNLLIARTSALYGDRPASGKPNFALWIMESLKNGKAVKILTDQFVSPALNTNLAEMILEACEKRLNGVYHMSGASRVSRYEFAVRIAEVFKLKKTLIKKAEMSDLGWVAKRPKDSSLDVSKAQKALRTKPMSLNESLNILKGEIEFASRNSS